MKYVEKHDNILSIPVESIENKIFVIRGQKVLLDVDLAKLYGVATKVLNQAVKRNINRFPPDFMFKLSKLEKDYVVTICDHLKRVKYSYQDPSAFTEQGVAMLSSILKGEKAALVNIAIMRTFVKLRILVSSHKELSQKLSEIEHRIERHDEDIISIFSAIRMLMQPEEKSKGKIGFLRN